MRRVLGFAIMIDGVLQALGVAGLLSSIADRDLRDQTLFALHLIAGAALVFVGRVLMSNGDAAKLGPAVVVGALLLSIFEATWFDWVGTVVRALYTVVALFILFRKTTLPTT